MDKSAIITLLVNAAVTILTTVIVTRITLGKPSLFSAAAIKSAASSTFRRYRAVSIDALLLVLNFYYVVRFLASDTSISKFDLINVPLNVLNLLAFSIFLFVDLARARADLANKGMEPTR